MLVGDTGGLVVIAPAEARAVLAVVDALLGKARTLQNNIAPVTADRRWVDETLTAKDCIL